MICKQLDMVVFQRTLWSRQYLVAVVWLLDMVAMHGNFRVAGSSNITCIEGERRALLKFKRGLVFDSYSLLSDWSRENPNCCRWQGIQCSKRGHVVTLDLGLDMKCKGVRGCDNVRIRGEIGSSLLELPYLSNLNLNQNDFTKIPTFIGSLKRLRYLNLSGSDLVGIIPHQLGNLSALETLDLSLSFNLEVDSLAWISGLSSLKYLNMNDVNLSTTDWVRSISQLPFLTNLYLSRCWLTLQLAPSNVNSSKSLEVLDLSWNRLHVAALEPWLNNSDKLVDLRIPLTSSIGPIPDYFSSLKSIEHLDLSSNRFEDEIPQTFSNLSNLLTLDISENWINSSSGFLRSGSTSLREFYLDSNNLSGSLPDFSKFPSLEVLSVAHNKFEGDLPESLLQNSNLTELDVSSNYLSGVLEHDHFLKLFKLQVLSLSFNSFTLNFSPRWIPPFQLRVVKLKHCKLGPTFPSWFRTQGNMTHLDISNSEVSDVMPSWFGDISSRLQYLNLSQNKISGKLPNSLPSCSFVDLRFNQFRGPLPSFFSELLLLDLSNNRFSGNISVLCSLKVGELVYLDLSDNLLSGSLPNCWKRLKGLSLLNLNNNNFSGYLPSSIGNLRNVISLRLRNNHLSGELTPYLKRCQSLLLLDLGENQFSGKIPTWIGTSLTSLGLLRLRSNKFYGDIPPAICRLNSTQILDLSFNNISGAVPSCLNNFTAMAHKEISSRYLFSYSIGFEEEATLLDGFSAWVVWKGLDREFVNERNLKQLKLIDLSSNRLTGPIPEELASLYELVSINLSRNSMTGEIPNKIGQLTMLESLDLSNNMLTGEIPRSMANISALTFLELSHNNLSGSIPVSTQLQGFNAIHYMGNPLLCGPPLTNSCSGNETSHDLPVPGISSDNKIDEVPWFHEDPWLYVSIVVGYIAGFWGVCGTLLLKKSWRQKYFEILDLVKEQLRMAVVLVGMAILRHRIAS